MQNEDGGLPSLAAVARTALRHQGDGDLTVVVARPAVCDDFRVACQRLPSYATRDDGDFAVELTELRDWASARPVGTEAAALYRNPDPTNGVWVYLVLTEDRTQPARAGELTVLRAVQALLSLQDLALELWVGDPAGAPECDPAHVVHELMVAGEWARLPKRRRLGVVVQPGLPPADDLVRSRSCAVVVVPSSRRDQHLLITQGLTGAQWSPDPLGLLSALPDPLASAVLADPDRWHMAARVGGPRAAPTTLRVLGSPTIVFLNDTTRLRGAWLQTPSASECRAPDPGLGVLASAHELAELLALATGSGAGPVRVGESAAAAFPEKEAADGVGVCVGPEPPARTWLDQRQLSSTEFAGGGLHHTPNPALPAAMAVLAGVPLAEATRELAPPQVRSAFLLRALRRAVARTDPDAAAEAARLLEDAEALADAVGDVYEARVLDGDGSFAFLADCATAFAAAADTDVALRLGVVEVARVWLAVGMPDRATPLLRQIADQRASDHAGIRALRLLAGAQRRAGDTEGAARTAQELVTAFEATPKNDALLHARLLDDGGVLLHTDAHAMAHDMRADALLAGASAQPRALREAFHRVANGWVDFRNAQEATRLTELAARQNVPTNGAFPSSRTLSTADRLALARAAPAYRSRAAHLYAELREQDTTAAGLCASAAQHGDTVAWVVRVRLNPDEALGCPDTVDGNGVLALRCWKQQPEERTLLTMAVCAHNRAARVEQAVLDKDEAQLEKLLLDWPPTGRDDDEQGRAAWSALQDLVTTRGGALLTEETGAWEQLMAEERRSHLETTALQTIRGVGNEGTHGLDQLSVDEDTERGRVDLLAAEERERGQLQHEGAVGLLQAQASAGATAIQDDATTSAASLHSQFETERASLGERIALTDTLFAARDELVNEETGAWGLLQTKASLGQLDATALQGRGGVETEAAHTLDLLRLKENAERRRIDLGATEKLERTGLLGAQAEIAASLQTQFETERAGLWERMAERERERDSIASAEEAERTQKEKDEAAARVLVQAQAQEAERTQKEERARADALDSAMRTGDAGVLADACRTNGSARVCLAAGSQLVRTGGPLPVFCVARDLLMRGAGSSAAARQLLLLLHKGGLACQPSAAHLATLGSCDGKPDADLDEHGQALWQAVCSSGAIDAAPFPAATAVLSGTRAAAAHQDGDPAWRGKAAVAARQGSAAAAWLLAAEGDAEWQAFCAEKALVPEARLHAIERTDPAEARVGPLAELAVDWPDLAGLPRAMARATGDWTSVAETAGTDDIEAHAGLAKQRGDPQLAIRAAERAAADHKPVAAYGLYRAAQRSLGADRGAVAVLTALVALVDKHFLWWPTDEEMTEVLGAAVAAKVPSALRLAGRTEEAAQAGDVLAGLEVPSYADGARRRLAPLASGFMGAWRARSPPVVDGRDARVLRFLAGGRDPADVTALRAVADAGDGEAQYLYGQHMGDTGRRYLELAADQGHGGAAAALAELSTGTAEVRFARQAAVAGFIEARIRYLALCEAAAAAPEDDRACLDGLHALDNDWPNDSDVSTVLGDVYREGRCGVAVHRGRAIGYYERALGAADPAQRQAPAYWLARLHARSDDGNTELMQEAAAVAGPLKAQAEAALVAIKDPLGWPECPPDTEEAMTRDAARAWWSGAIPGVDPGPFALGVAALEGQGPPPGGCDVGVAWLTRAARAPGSSCAAGELGALVAAGGCGLSSDPHRAFGLHMLAAGRGCVDSMLQVARGFLSGTGCVADEDRAVAWFSEAARRGSAEAHYRLGRLHQQHDPPRASAARREFQEAAQSDSRFAGKALRRLGQAVLGTDEGQARRLFDQSSTAGALVELAALAERDQQQPGVPLQALSLLERAVRVAAGRCRKAHERLLGLYDLHGARPPSVEAAFATYSAANALGVAGAARRLAGLHLRGVCGVPFDPRRARALVDGAIAGGDPLAALKLARAVAARAALAEADTKPTPRLRRRALLATDDDLEDTRRAAALSTARRLFAPVAEDPAALRAARLRLRLALAQECGDELDRDDLRAATLAVQQAADAGCARCHYILARANPVQVWRWWPFTSAPSRGTARAAELGYAPAMLRPDADQHQLQTAAAAGLPEAQFRLAELDEAGAAALYAAAAENGHGPSALWMGRRSVDDREWTAAARWFQEALLQSESEAAAPLCDLYEHDRAFPPSPREFCLHVLRACADAGTPIGQRMLGLELLADASTQNEGQRLVREAVTGRDPVAIVTASTAPDPNPYSSVLRRVAGALISNPTANAMAALRIDAQHNPSAKFEMLWRAVNSHPQDTASWDALARLGGEFGKAAFYAGVVKANGDAKTAMSWFRRALAHGSLHGAVAVALRTTDQDEALRLLRSSAAAGFPRAQLALAQRLLAEPAAELAVVTEARGLLERVRDGAPVLVGQGVIAQARRALARSFDRTPPAVGGDLARAIALFDECAGPDGNDDPEALARLLWLWDWAGRIPRLVDRVRTLCRAAMADTHQPATRARAMRWLGINTPGPDGDKLLASAWDLGDAAAGLLCPTPGVRAKAVLALRAEAEGPGNAETVALARQRLAEVPTEPAAGAVALLRQAADAGSPLAHLALGRLHDADGGGEPDAPAAVRHLVAAWEGGVPEAAPALARLYDLGLGVPPDRHKAVEWLERGAAADDPEACRALAPRVRAGIDGLVADPTRADHLQAQAGDPTPPVPVPGTREPLSQMPMLVAFATGVQHEEAGDALRAAAHFTKAVELAGEHKAAPASGALGRLLLLYDRTGISPETPVRLVELCHLALEWLPDDHPAKATACYVLGCRLRTGVGVHRDPVAGAGLVNRAVALGDPTALLSTEDSPEQQRGRVWLRAADPYVARRLFETTGDTALLELAVQGGDPGALFEMANRTTDAERFRLLKQAAQAGWAPAAMQLSEHHGGAATPQGMAYLERAAECNFPPALRALGMRLLDKSPPDQDRAVSMLVRARLWKPRDGAYALPKLPSYRPAAGHPDPLVEMWLEPGPEYSPRKAGLRLFKLGDEGDVLAQGRLLGLVADGRFEFETPGIADAFLRKVAEADPMFGAAVRLRADLLPESSPGDREALLDQAARAGDLEARARVLRTTKHTDSACQALVSDVESAAKGSGPRAGEAALLRARMARDGLCVTASPDQRLQWLQTRQAQATPCGPFELWQAITPTDPRRPELHERAFIRRCVKAQPRATTAAPVAVVAPAVPPLGS